MAKILRFPPLAVDLGDHVRVAKEGHTPCKKAKEREDCVLRDLLGAARIRTVTLMAALLITLLAALGLMMYYADAIDNWRP
jgi:hypothetical protein